MAISLVRYATTAFSQSPVSRESLRTTIPKQLVEIFGLKHGDEIEWEFDPTKGRLEATVRKALK